MTLEEFLANPTKDLYYLIDDKKLARSNLNRDSALHLYFLYKIGYLSSEEEVIKYAIREGRMDIVKELICKTFFNYSSIIEEAAKKGDESLVYEIVGRSDDEDIINDAIHGAIQGWL